MNKLVSRLCLALSTILLFGHYSFAQNSGDPARVFVQQKYPLLYDEFKSDLDNVHATYTFAIDVSGTMNQYASIVQPALLDFISALPDGDYLHIIRFGTTAKDKDSGYLGKISSETRPDFRRNAGRLYSDPNDRPAGEPNPKFKSYTDVPKAIAAAAHSISMSNDDLNFVFIMTDFKNEEYGKTRGGNLIAQSDIDDLHSKMLSATCGKNGRIVTLRLPVNTMTQGYCLPQLPGVFNGLDLTYESQDITSPEALRQWFTALRKEIMEQKLKAIVERENRLINVNRAMEINIDGKVTSNIGFKPNRIYKTVHIDSTVVVPADSSKCLYKFKNNKKAFKDYSPKEISKKPIKLGQIKHESWGFHNCKDSLLLGISFPTPYDDEFFKLQVKPEIAHIAEPINKIIFTCFLPLWAVCAIFAAILLYIILLFRAVKVNKKRKFVVSRIKISAMDGATILVNKSFSPPKKMDGFTVPGIVPANVPWKMKFEKKKGNPFLLFKKPTLIASISQGNMKINGGKKSATTFKKATPYKVGVNGNYTHKVTIS